MACCGRGGGNKGISAPKVISPTPPALPQTERSVPPPAAAHPPRPKTIIQPRTSQPQPKAPTPLPEALALPPCRFREFRSKHIIGGKEVETYFCKAFNMNVRQEHCRVCPKADK